VDGRDFFGINKLNLNSAVVDCSYLKDYLAYSVLRDLGLAAERTGSAWVTVNGEDYGLYVILEQPDDRMLERHYADPTGNLYDGKYAYYEDGSYTLLDFGAGVDSLYELEEGTDVGHVDITAISTLVQDYTGRPEFWATSETLVNWDRLLLYFAAEEYIGHNDGYCLNTNNNFPYFSADDGRMEMLPWDMDYSFLQAGDWGMDWNRPRGRLAVACRRSEECIALWAEKVAELLDTIDSEAYMVLAQEHAALLQPYVEADPRRECGLDSVAWYQGYLQTWFTNRENTMTVRWGL
jgi:spore coat protein CotH